MQPHFYRASVQSSYTAVACFQRSPLFGNCADTSCGRSLRPLLLLFGENAAARDDAS
jgi:hypothetical protein